MERGELLGKTDDAFLSAPRAASYMSGDSQILAGVSVIEREDTVAYEGLVMEEHTLNGHSHCSRKEGGRNSTLRCSISFSITSTMRSPFEARLLRDRRSSAAG
jgi:hypothetical protein